MKVTVPPLSIIVLGVQLSVVSVQYFVVGSESRLSFSVIVTVYGGTCTLDIELSDVVGAV